ncbi:hypothetical protein ACWCXH_11415 [Kitasatospora sp. NPDC001660]
MNELGERTVEADDTAGTPRIAILDGRYQLAVHGLARAEDAFAVAYSVTPPMPGDLRIPSPVAPQPSLRLEADDDLGHRYTGSGGAHGLSADGLRTEGTVSGRPAVAAAAAELRVRLVFLLGPEEYAYRLAFPLSP